MCISSSSSVGVGACITSRRMPIGVGFASSPAHSKVVDLCTGFCWAASVASEPAAAAVIAIRQILNSAHRFSFVSFVFTALPSVHASPVG